MSDVHARLDALVSRVERLLLGMRTSEVNIAAPVPNEAKRKRNMTEDEMLALEPEEPPDHDVGDYDEKRRKKKEQWSQINTNWDTKIAQFEKVSFSTPPSTWDHLSRTLTYKTNGITQYVVMKVVGDFITRRVFVENNTVQLCLTEMEFGDLSICISNSFQVADMPRFMNFLASNYNGPVHLARYIMNNFPACKMFSEVGELSK